jgi:hypothetical protein
VFKIAEKGWSNRQKGRVEEATFSNARTEIKS